MNTAIESGSFGAAARTRSLRRVPGCVFQMSEAFDACNVDEVGCRIGRVFRLRDRGRRTDVSAPVHFQNFPGGFLRWGASVFSYSLARLVDGHRSAPLEERS